MQKRQAFLKRLNTAIQRDAEAEGYPPGSLYGTTSEAFAQLIKVAASDYVAPYTKGQGRWKLAHDKMNYLNGRVGRTWMEKRLTACPCFERVHNLPDFWVYVPRENPKLQS